MNANLTIEPEVQCDASLIELSLTGDRDAFGQIVARYQSPICALAYSACGNVARSEDLAQEIFIAAWRKLSSLKEPAQFKAWLYGIARNLINNAFRQHQRNPVALAESFEGAAEPVSPADEPDEQAISKEEASILWHVLAGIPEIYREPMVLYYRQNESITKVADVMEISEEAVRQRLSRGRALLNDRVTKVVHSGLRRTAPADTFAVAVIASLPMLAAVTTAKGSVIGMATTKGATGQATGLIGLLKGIGLFAGIIAIPATIGTYFGHRLGQDAAGLPQQRKSVTKFWRVFGCGLVLFLVLPLLLTFSVTGFLSGANRAEFLSIMTIWMGLSYPFVFGSLLYWSWQRRRKPANAEPLNAAGQSEASVNPVGAIPVSTNKKISSRLVLYLTVAAAALLVYCYLDTNHNVGHLGSAELRELINQSAPGELNVSVMEGNNHSIWGESSQMYRYFWVEVHQNGKVAKYIANADDATLGLIAQKKINCPTYIAGRDFEILGTPGRFLPFMAAFVLAIGLIFLFKRRRPANSVVK
ncbi:MAG: RNA polymerase sigma factor [Verrucomicrobiota bacterium]|jgi:RNA polymerase sigma factor (sigma-70 family)